MNIKVWNTLALDKDAAARLGQQYDLPFFLAMLLQIRGHTSPEDIAALLGGDGALSDPFALKDMDRAAQRVRRAVDAFEKIAVYGDYDADGITATAVLYTYLEACGADVTAYIPERSTEGYGMNAEAVRALAQDGVKLIVTVDNGIACCEEVALAASLGVDVVVTDHHRPQGTLPAAAAVVDPYRADNGPCYRHFSGCGVAFKLVQALETDVTSGEDLLDMYADLLTLGTLGDVMPVDGENRMYVRRGLQALANSERPGIAALLEESSMQGRRLTATSVSFSLVPRINAAGRMGSAERAMRLLVSEDAQEAGELARDICAANDQRRRCEMQMIEQVQQQLAEHPQLLLDRVLVVEGEDWPSGVVGIVASKLTDLYGKPCVVCSREGDDVRASGRSVEGFSLFDAVHHCRDLLTKYGGHPMAAGLSMPKENVEEFRRRINEFARRVAPKMPAQQITVDCRLNPAALRADMPASVAPLEPFGTGNPEPLFGLYNMRLEEIVPVGNGQHLRLLCTRGGTAVTLMKFFTRPQEFPYAPGMSLDFAVRLEAREYRGAPELSIVVEEIKPAGFDTETAVHALRIYESFRRGEPMKKATAAYLLPPRELFAQVYRLLRGRQGWEQDEWALLCALNCPAQKLAQLLVALDVLEERGLLRRGGEAGKTFSLLPTDAKADLTKSSVLKAVEKLCVL